MKEHLNQILQKNGLVLITITKQWPWVQNKEETVMHCLQLEIWKEYKCGNAAVNINMGHKI